MLGKDNVSADGMTINFVAGRRMQVRCGRGGQVTVAGGEFGGRLCGVASGEEGVAGDGVGTAGWRERAGLSARVGT